MNSPFKIYGCSEAIDFNITNEEISINSLVENYQNRDYKSLVNNAQQYVEKNNSSAMAWNLLALGYRYTNNVEAALKIYEDLLRLNPGNFLLSTNLGNLYMAIGKISKAIDCFEVAFKKEPNHVSNLEALAIAYQDTGRNKEAIDCFKKVLALDEGKESARYHLARMLVRLNYYSEAIEHFDKTNYGLSKSHLLECLYYLGDKDKFYEHYRELINRKIINPLMASIGSHASIRFNISNKENPFCSDPFNYIKKQNITDNNELNDDLISSILEFHKSGESDPKSQPLLSNGKQSSGNIFLNPGNDGGLVNAGGNTGPDFAEGKVYIGRAASKYEVFHGGSHSLPDADNTYDLGSSSKRFRFVYTTDLQLSNENTGGNEVDGTWGNYTIQEGADDLFLINRRSGKRYKFNLTEVS